MASEKSNKKKIKDDPGSAGRLLDSRYLLIAEFSENSSKTSQMFKAADINLRREIAVKLFQPRLKENKDFISALEQQAMKIAQLNQINITAFYNWGVDDSPYMVTELCRGESLAKLIEACRQDSSEGKNIEGSLFQGGLNPTQIAFIGKQAAEGLTHAHAKGVLHQNLSPTNILFDLEGRVKLSDFGIAKLFEQKGPVSISENLLGSGFYSAPEVLDEEKTATEKSDVFSLGLVLLESALGVPPFDQKDHIDTYINRLQKPFEVPGELEELGDILSLAIKIDPEERPSATEFAWHLNGFLTMQKQGDITKLLPLQLSPLMIKQENVNWKKYRPAPDPLLDETPEIEVKEVELDAKKIYQKVQERVLQKIQNEDFLHPQPIEVSRTSKISKFGLVLAILSVLAVASLTAFSVLNRFDFFEDNEQSTIVPDVVGLTTEEAVAALGDRWEVETFNLRVEGVEKGNVALINPPAGARLESGKTISITSSYGDPLVLLPINLLGVSLESAEIRLAGIGLILGEIYQRSPGSDRLTLIERSEASFSQDILVGYNEPTGEVEWGSEVAVIIVG